MARVDLFLERSQERQPCLLELAWPWSFLSWHILCLFIKATLFSFLFLFSTSHCYSLKCSKSMLASLPPLHGAVTVLDPISLLTQGIPSVSNGHLITFSTPPRESYATRSIHRTETPSNLCLHRWLFTCTRSDILIIQMIDLAFGAFFTNFPPPPHTPSVNFKSSCFHMEDAVRKTKACFEK